MSEQLSFRLPFREAMDAAQFFISDSNQHAVAWIDRWPDWPHHALVLCGPLGSGKTHLAHVWQKKSAAAFVNLKNMTPPSGHSILDISSPPPFTRNDEQALFHFLNSIQQEKQSLLILAREAPARWPIQLPDLASRLNAIPLALIEEPDDKLLFSLFAKQFLDRQLPVDDEIIHYLMKHIDRSFSSVRESVEHIDRFQLKTKRPYNLNLIRDALRSLQKG